MAKQSNTGNPSARQSVSDRLRAWLPPAGVTLEREDYDLINGEAADTIDALVEALKAWESFDNEPAHKGQAKNYELLGRARELTRAAIAKAEGR